MLMKRVMQRLTKDNTETHAVASFFIYGQGVPLQKSRMGLYSAMIHQLCQPLSTAFQGLISEFQNRTDTRGKYGEKWKWAMEDIRSHLFEALKLGSETKSIMIFVDALDEAGEEEAQEIIRDFDGLLGGLSESKSKIKVCFSCRHYPDLRLSHAMAISVEEHNHGDIQMVIDDHLQKLAPNEQTMFRREIVKRSGGIFHWATLVVNRAVRERKKGKPLRIVFSTFQKGQADLYQLYEALLSELEEGDRVQAIRLFQWMLFAKGSLTLPELQHAMALSHDMQESSISEYLTGKYFTDENDLKTRIVDLSKGLVEVRYFEDWIRYRNSPQVQFIHQSVVDYLLESGLETLEMTQDATISSSINVRAHFEISRSCLRMLFMSEFKSFDRDDYHIQDDLAAYLSSKSSDTFRYWWDYWIVHILKIENERHPLPRCYRDYKGLKTQDETDWQDLPDQYDQCDLLDYFSWPGSDKFLQICVRFHNGLRHSKSLANLRDAFFRIWRVKTAFHGQLATNVWCFALCGSSLIHFLALSGLKAPLQRMIISARASLDVWDREGRTPLMYAIIGFAFEIAMDLIHAMVDVNAQDIYGNTALHFASFCGEQNVVEALLQAGANASLERIGGATPLHLAIIAQHPPIVAKLLHANADSEKSLLTKHPERDEKCCQMSALTYVSLEGHHTVAKLLLSHGAQPSVFDHFGVSPLHYCASLGHVEVIRALVEAGASVDAQDPSGRTPLAMAIEHNHQQAAEILIRAGANAMLPGYDNWTPLDIAASDGHVDLARLLISNRVSLGKSLFHAAFDGHADMVDFLIRSGAKVEDQDRFGRTPLFLAAAKGQTEAAVRLINAKTPLNHTDSEGKTALFYAVASIGSSKTARALLDAGTDPNWHDFKGLSPMKYAAYSYCELDTVKALLEFGAERLQPSEETEAYKLVLRCLGLVEEIKEGFRRQLERENS